jgi:hypothetical protein
MKKIIIVLLAILAIARLNAQYESKPIGKGSTLEYAVTPYHSFVNASLFIEQLAADSISMRWSIKHLSGRRVMSKNSIETGTLGYWAPPYNGENMVLPEQQTLFCISRSSFAALKEKGEMEFDGQVLEMIYTYNQLIYEAGGKKIPAIRAENIGGTTRIWIADDPFFPVILKLEGNPFHVDFELLDVK